MSGPFASPFGANTNPFDSDRNHFASSSIHRVTEKDENDTSATAIPWANSGSIGADAASDVPPTTRNQQPHDSYPAHYNYGRRTSVSAESLKPSADTYDNWSPPYHEKTSDQIERLKRAIQGNFLFSHLDEEQSAQILGALVEKVIPAKGIKVRHMPLKDHSSFYPVSLPCREGDDVDLRYQIVSQGDAGDFFYVVERGAFDVHVNSSGTIQPGPDGLGEKVGNIQAGGSFGELALMYNAPRAATVISVELSCTLWALDRNTFRRILMESTFARRRMYESFLEEVPLLLTLTLYERSKIADALEAQKFAPGATIIKEGDRGHAFFLLESGEADAYKEGADEPVRHYEKGDFFGELALLNDAPRAASVVASSHVKVATLGKSAFQRLLGPVEGILRRTRYDGVKSGVEEMDPLHRE